VDLWRVVVEASLAEFQPFYDSLDVHIDFVLGESFYAQVGLALVREWLESGAAVVYSDAEAAVDLAEIDRAVADGGLTDAEADSARAGIEKDNDAVVVRLSATERYVVLRRDGRSVYSTRDLAAIAVRSDLFDPTSCIYVVGQEQQTHFSRLFAAAYRLGLADPDSMAFEHLSFGFYIDPTPKQKLSSRESVAGVAALFSTANDYFAGRVGETVDDPAAVAHQLTIASIVFNDLKQDTKSSVELDVNDPASLLEMFERSGGAYVIYAACRAGAVVRKAAGASAQSEIGALEDDEVALVLELLDTPRRLGSAAKGHDPSVVVRHLLTLSNLYNSYYSRRRVIGPDGVHTDRLRITAATEQVLRNGLRWCNVECPEAI
jgi:arginyl-tRNA synthetase